MASLHEESCMEERRTLLVSFLQDMRSSFLPELSKSLHPTVYYPCIVVLASYIKKAKRLLKFSKAGRTDKVIVMKK